jgi:hypothetical protein
MWPFISGIANTGMGVTQLQTFVFTGFCNMVYKEETGQ